MSRHQQLRDLLRAKKFVRLPGAYDVLSAKLIEQAGFPAVYVGSYSTAASTFGLADVGALTLSDLTEAAGRIVDGVAVPVIADAEGGLNEPANIWRTVSAFEKAGVSAIHIEDHAGGKHTRSAQSLIPLDLMLCKLKAAMDARSNPGFQIIARTDAIWAMHDAAEAMRRVEAFIDIGVDMVFPTGADPDFVRNLRRRHGVRVVGVQTHADAQRAAGGTPDLVLSYGFCMFAVTAALKGALALFRDSRAVDALRPLLEPVHDFESLFDYEAYSARTAHLNNWRNSNVKA